VGTDDHAVHPSCPYEFSEILRPRGPRAVVEVHRRAVADLGPPGQPGADLREVPAAPDDDHALRPQGCQQSQAGVTKRHEQDQGSGQPHGRGDRRPATAQGQFHEPERGTRQREAAPDPRGGHGAPVTDSRTSGVGARHGQAGEGGESQRRGHSEETLRASRAGTDRVADEKSRDAGGDGIGGEERDADDPPAGSLTEERQPGATAERHEFVDHQAPWAPSVGGRRFYGRTICIDVVDRPLS
jgi:hypothetical protein